MMRTISSVVIAPTKMSKSRIISAIVDSIAATISEPLSIRRFEAAIKAAGKLKFELVADLVEVESDKKFRPPELANGR
jgi:hypothetical protein